MMKEEELFAKYKPESIDRIVRYKDIPLFAITRSNYKSFLGREIKKLHIVRLDNGYGTGGITIDDNIESTRYIGQIIDNVEKQLEYIPKILEIIKSTYSKDLIVQDILLDWMSFSPNNSGILDTADYIYHDTDIKISIYYPQTGETKSTPVIALYNSFIGI